MHGDNLISAYEAARILEVAPVTVYAWIKRGEFGVYEDAVTGQLLLDRKEVEALRPARRVRKLPPR